MGRTISELFEGISRTTGLEMQISVISFLHLDVIFPRLDLVLCYSQKTSGNENINSINRKRYAGR